MKLDGYIIVGLFLIAVGVFAPATGTIIGFDLSSPNASSQLGLLLIVVGTVLLTIGILRQRKANPLS